MLEFGRGIYTSGRTELFCVTSHRIRLEHVLAGLSGDSLIAGSYLINAELANPYFGYQSRYVDTVYRMSI